jgi:hypothetical protein
VQNYFGVELGMKAMAQAFEFPPQFCVVIDLAVKRDDSVAVVTDDRLVAAAQIDDFQANRAQGYVIGVEDALLVGAPME